MTEAELEAAQAANLCTVDAFGRLIHPGLPQVWAAAIVIVMILTMTKTVVLPNTSIGNTRHIDLMALPYIGRLNRYLTSRAWPLLVAKLLVAALFLMIIIAGLFGTPIPERNAATVLTWNLWWSGLIIAVFFLGSAWCAVCPWDTLSTLLVRRRLWGPVQLGTSLNLRVPSYLRSVWPAVVLLLGLTWLELGVGITMSPYATAILALAMVVLATLSLALFERKAFCRYFCPVGRTVGAYSQLAPIELRPTDTEICASCTTLECYHGNSDVEPCPTHLVMGRLQQNTYCTSCGNCTRSCPYQNVSWRLRSPSSEAISDARPHWDEAGFMLGLLVLAGFHGLVMTGLWDTWRRDLGLALGESGQMLGSFTIGFAASLAVPLAIYCGAIWLAQSLNTGRIGFKKLFSQFAFAALPLAFAYHIAHNLSHLVLEGRGLGKVLANPLGINTLPLSDIEKQLRGSNLFVSQDMLHLIQTVVMAFGFIIAIRVIYNRSKILDPAEQQPQVLLSLPVQLFAVVVTVYHLWLLMQPMVMRY